ncbi:MAG: 50S ribosomal protein L23 [Kiritimatiellia bacterium]|jgi:large subunit ribosomal protein L23
MKQTDVIRRVLVTEKGTALAELNQYMLEVARGASKPQIRQAVEDQFGVHVLAVNTQRYKGETRVLRDRRKVRDGGWKRAIVTLKAGERIDLI